MSLIHSRSPSSSNAESLSTTLNVTIVRLHVSEATKIQKRWKFFVKVTVNHVSNTTRKESMAVGWDEELSFKIAGPTTVTVEVFRQRTIHQVQRDILIGSYKEDLETLLNNSFNQNVTQLISQHFWIEFKVNLEIPDVIGAISAMVERVNIRASYLQPSRSVKDIQLIGEVPFDDIAETGQSLLEKLQIFANLVKAIAEIHPYAQAAYNVVSVAYQAVVKQVDRDESIKCLILAMNDIYSFVKEAEPLQNIESHKEIMTQLSQQTIECGYFISAYCADTFLMRTIKYSVAPIDEAVTKYGKRFSELKTAILAHSTIRTEVTVLRIFETVKNTEITVDLGDLPYAKGVRFQSTEQCLPGTQKQIQQIIVNWINNPDPGYQRIFILEGPSGSGKSSIAHSIAVHFDNLGRLGSSIFPLPNTPGLLSLLFPTIARDLADLIPQYRGALWNTIKLNTALKLTEDLHDQYIKFIQGPSSSLTISGPIVIIIDGLDEYREHTKLERFLEVLAHQANDLPPNFRIVLIARDDSPIHEKFTGNPVAKCFSMEDIDGWVIKDDMLQIAKTKLAPLLAAELLEPLLLELVERSQGSFQSMMQTCKALCSTRGLNTSQVESFKHAINSRQSIPPQDDLFLTELERLASAHGPLFCTQFDFLMGHLIVAYTPLSLVELKQLGRYTQSFTHTNWVDCLSSLESFLENTQYYYKSISAFHPSFYEFLSDPVRSGKFWIDTTQYHFMFGRACLGVLSNQLQHLKPGKAPLYDCQCGEVQFEGCIIGGVGTTALPYASRFWMMHLNAALSTPPTGAGHASSFQIFLQRWACCWERALSVSGPLVKKAINELNWVFSLAQDSNELGHGKLFATTPKSLEHILLAVGPMIQRFLKDKNSRIRGAAVSFIGEMAHNEMLHDVISTPLPSIVNNLKYYESNVRQATVDCISKIMKHERFQNMISITLPSIVEHLRDHDSLVRKVTVDCISEFSKHERFHDVLLIILPSIVEHLKNRYLREASLKCISEFAKHKIFHDMLSANLPSIVECLEYRDSEVRRATLNCISEFAKHDISHDMLSATLPSIVECLKYHDADVRKATVDCISEFAMHERFHDVLSATLPSIMECLKDYDSDVIQAAMDCIHELTKHKRFDDVLSVTLKNFEMLEGP